MNEPQKGIKYKVLIAGFLPAVITLIILSVYHLNLEINNLTNELQQRGRLLADQLAPTSAYGVYSGNQNVLQDICDNAILQQDIAHISIIDRNEKVLVEIANDQLTEQHSEFTLFSSPIRIAEADIDDFAGEQTTHPNPDVDQNVIGWVRLITSDNRLQNEINKTITNAVGIGIISLVISLIFSYRLGRTLSLPILRLSANIKNLDKAYLMDTKGSYEIAELSELESAVVNMSDKLKTANKQLSHKVHEQTQELKETLESVEIQNAQLDISRKKALDATLIKSAFLANMSHEIRTPLGGMIGYTNLLRKTVLTREQKEYITTIEKSASHLRSIINETLDFSTLESGKFRLDEKPFNLKELLESTVSMLSPTMHEKSLEFCLLLYTDVPNHLIGDAPRIRQILLNLIGNAMKFTEHGSVIVRTMLEEEQPSSAQIKIQVTDTGIGIPLDQQKHLFQAFSQIDSTYTKKYEGTGLGLTISKKMTEAMGGNIHYESEEGSGSTFWFTIPLAKQENPVVIENPKKEALKGRHVFLYDSHSVSNLTIFQHLTNCGIDTVRVSKADEILSTLKQCIIPIELVVLGLSQQELVADEMAQLIETIANDYDLPIILAGSYSNLSICTNPIYQQIPKGFLAKPLLENNFIHLMHQVITTGDGMNDNDPEALSEPVPFNDAFDFSFLDILVVDDSEINRKLTVKLLELAGAETFEADDGDVAVEIALEQTFDVILMDLHMPHKDGQQATREIRQQSKNQTTPIIALTANVLKSTKEKLFGSGFDDYLTKPLAESDLLNAVAKWTGDGNLGDKVTSAASSDNVRAQLIIELKQQFFEELPEQIHLIKKAISNLDMERLFALTHKLTGGAAACQETQLMTLLRAMETAIHEGATDEYLDKFTQLEAYPIPDINNA